MYFTGIKKAGNFSCFFSAEKGTRTLDPFITSEVLYRLSYFGNYLTQIIIMGIIYFCKGIFPRKVFSEDCQKI